MENIIEETKHPKKIGRYILLSIVIFVVAYFVVLPNIKNKSVTQDEILTASQHHASLMLQISWYNHEIAIKEWQVIDLQDRIDLLNTNIKSEKQIVLKLNEEANKIEDALCNLRKAIWISCTTWSIYSWSDLWTKSN